MVSYKCSSVGIFVILDKKSYFFIKMVALIYFPYTYSSFVDKKEMYSKIKHRNVHSTQHIYSHLCVSVPFITITP